MRLLMSEPNVLMLDEPTNDLDVETLTALEDLLDRWPGTLVVVSHDRYFVERVADDVYALDALGGIRHLPGGIDQYLSEVEAGPDRSATELGKDAAGGEHGSTRAREGTAPPRGGALRQARKDLQRLERDLERLTARERELHAAMAAVATDHAQLAALTAELDRLSGERETAEASWLETAALLED
jgi:ATP-binding cassette subfamily F protein uup